MNFYRIPRYPTITDKFLQGKLKPVFQDEFWKKPEQRRRSPVYSSEETTHRLLRWDLDELGQRMGKGQATAPIQCYSSCPVFQSRLFGRLSSGHQLPIWCWDRKHHGGRLLRWRLWKWCCRGENSSRRCPYPLRCG